MEKVLKPLSEGSDIFNWTLKGKGDRKAEYGAENQHSL